MTEYSLMYANEQTFRWITWLGGYKTKHQPNPNLFIVKLSLFTSSKLFGLYMFQAF